MDYADLFLNEFLKPELDERHHYFSVYRVVESPTPEKFVDVLSNTARLMLEDAQHDVRRYGSSIISASVQHSSEVITRRSKDLATGQEIESVETIHTFRTDFECTGREDLSPRAGVRRAMNEFLLLDTVEYLTVGQQIEVPGGAATVVMIDSACSIVRLDRSAGLKPFPVYAVGDPGAEKLLADTDIVPAKGKPFPKKVTTP